jgi:hypothetical protein
MAQVEYMAITLSKAVQSFTHFAADDFPARQQN